MGEEGLELSGDTEDEVEVMLKTLVIVEDGLSACIFASVMFY